MIKLSHLQEVDVVADAGGTERRTIRPHRGKLLVLRDEPRATVGLLHVPDVARKKRESVRGVIVAIGEFPRDPAERERLRVDLFCEGIAVYFDPLSEHALAEHGVPCDDRLYVVRMDAVLLVEDE